MMDCRVMLIIVVTLPTGGREKAPAAFCRKALTSTHTFEMWGDGKQTRSFTFIDECVEGVLRYPCHTYFTMGIGHINFV